MKEEIKTRKEGITIDDVIEFIVKNSEHTEWMDKLNKATFPFTSKYAEFSRTTQYIPIRKIDKCDEFNFIF